MLVQIVVVAVVVLLLLLLVSKSFHLIGAAEVGLVAKRFGLHKLAEDNPSPSAGRPATKRRC